MKKILWRILGYSVFLGVGAYVLYIAPVLGIAPEMTVEEIKNPHLINWAIWLGVPAFVIWIFGMADMRLTQREIKRLRRTE